MANESDTPVLGTLRSNGAIGVVRIEADYHTDVRRLWAALTKPTELARWFGPVTGELRSGGEFQFHVESDALDGVGRIEVCDPPSRLIVNLRETDESARAGAGVAPFDKRVTADIAGAEGRARIVLEVAGPPLDVLPFFGVGWQIHAENLGAYLDGREADDVEARWSRLLPLYQALLVGRGPSSEGRP